ncbi:aspartyl-phosphate phosphatase Spo0E family protein [Paludifilum halophilum]|uniref:Aspartyl-phosphate phosphatase Spo0E family protein n=1 Tax=Paludifilum halophilum TaxID=1642702 RepID=A0A235B4I4_9BACL|nr:aspartyl-phosphate phosphatase Spo0E family protein [Paludifilum halophilum]OYD07193.1 hypothetical protein CHM34_12475 [Paludifilum halophilum]
MMGRKQLEREIEKVRKRMEQKAAELGLSHPSVIRISQRLDELHNQWNRFHRIETKHFKEERGVYIIRRYTSKIREVAVGRI